jgi:putative ABC transport system permease protein
MNWNYLKIAWRIILKNKTNTIINIVGLGIGFSVSVLLMIYVFHQLSFDKFHPNADRIYRLTIEGSMADGKVLSGAITSGEIAETILNGVPGIEEVSRLYSWGNEVFIEQQRFTGNKIVWADTSFFRMFNFPFIHGHPQHALLEPYTIVLTEETAQKFFGRSDILGQTLKIANLDYLITGVIKNIPEQSSIRFHAIGAFASLVRPDWNIVNQEGISFPTYLMFQKGVDNEMVASQLIEVADKQIQERFGPFGIHFSHNLQPLGKVHLHSQFNFDDSYTGDIRNVYIFSFLAFFVILIAMFNFVNLVTAQSEKRAREIGMRKVLGASKEDLVKQFIGESIIIASIAFVFSLMLNEVLIQSFSNLLGYTFNLEYWNRPAMFAGMVFFMILIGVVSGIYPAFYLSRHQPVIVLKGLQSGNGKSHSLRKLLVGLQFAISIFLVITILLGHRQVSYMKNKDIGFDRENVVTIRNLTDNIRQSYESIKSELLQHPDVLYVTASQSIPGEDRSVQNSRKKGDDPASAIMIHENRVQHGYLETFGMRLIEGRDFDPEMRTDSSAIIINQKAANLLGLENPIGEEIYVWQHVGRVIGVVEDYNYLSLHNDIDPIALTMYQSWFRSVSIRVLPGSLIQTLGYIRERFEAADPNYIFDYLFVDDTFRRMYQKEEQIGRLITAAAILAIIISILGLYALTTFAIRQKVKEIGIRKVMGATTLQIIRVLFREFSRWIIMGNILAWPIAFYVFTSWQQNFAFQINALDYWWLFIVAGILTGLIGFFAIFYQAVMAASANPVDSLRSE